MHNSIVEFNRFDPCKQSHESEAPQLTVITMLSVAETLPEVPFERPTPPKEHGWLSDFQRELVELASFLNGDYMLTSLAQEARTKTMTVKQADAYVRRAITGFLQASKQAVRLGANESAIVTMRPSLTSN